MAWFRAGVHQDEAAAALHTASCFLAKRDIPCLSEEWVKDKIDLIIVAGNAVLDTINSAAAAHRLTGSRILISGGVGHSTPFLYEALSASTVIRSDMKACYTEAELLSLCLQREYSIPPDMLILETRSTNTGENALFSLRCIQEHMQMPNRILLIQDPLMQIRTKATFRKVWQDARQMHTDFVSFAAFLPDVQVIPSGELILGGGASLWSHERFLSLLMGEFSRLWDDEDGYGPRGRNFIQQVTIPQTVQDAYMYLRQWLIPCHHSITR